MRKSLDRGTHGTGNNQTEDFLQPGETPANLPAADATANGAQTPRGSKKQDTQGVNGDARTAFDKFHEAHGRKRYTPTFNEALRTLVSDVDAQEERAWALAILKSWGNPTDPKDYAVDDGEKLGITDFAKLLGLSKQRVSEYVQSLSAKNRLHLVDGALYPVDDPSQPFGQRLSVTNGKQQKAATWAEFRPHFAAEHPVAVRQREEARAVVEEVNRAELAAFKAWKKTGSLRTTAENRPATPPEPVRHSPPKPSGDSPHFETLSLRVPKKRSSDDPSSSFSALRDAVTLYAKVVDDDALAQLQKACRKNAPDATDEEIIHFVKVTGAKINPNPDATRNRMGVLLSGVPKCFAGESFREYRAERSRQQKREAEEEERVRYGWAEPRSTFESQLADPKIPEDTKEAIRRILANAKDASVPQASPKAKAKAAGQG